MEIILNIDDSFSFQLNYLHYMSLFFYIIIDIDKLVKTVTDRQKINYLSNRVYEL